MAALVLRCPHRPACPGCPRFGEAGLAPGTTRRVAALAETAGLPAPALVEGPPLGFRQRARLMVRGRPGAPKIGLFEQGTHRVVAIPRCEIHDPLVNEVAVCLGDEMHARRTAPYAERSGQGLVRALQVVVERASRSVQVVLVTNERAPGADSRALCDALARSLGRRLHSLWWNGQPTRTNVILGPHWQHLRGPSAVRERMGGADVFFPPGAFGQSQLALADAIVERVQGAVPDGARVAEFFAGCGALGLGLLPRVRSAVFNESSEASLEGLTLGLAARSEAERARAVVLPGRAEDRLEALADADVVILDPPRKGLDPKLVDALRAQRPERVLILSCGLDSFERDTARLSAPGGLRLHGLEAFGLFPYTEHVELLATFGP